jgi:hypothetical protein
MRNAAIAILIAFVTTPVFGDQSTPDPAANARFGALRQKKPSDPYRQLFQSQQALKQALDGQTGTRQPKIVCGMLVVPADPSIDPKMRITPPQDPNVEYKIRAIEPPMCNPAK